MSVEGPHIGSQKLSSVEALLSNQEFEGNFLTVSAPLVQKDSADQSLALTDGPISNTPAVTERRDGASTPTPSSPPSPVPVTSAPLPSSSLYVPEKQYVRLPPVRRQTLHVAESPAVMNARIPLQSSPTAFGPQPGPVASTRQPYNSGWATPQLYSSPAPMSHRSVSPKIYPTPSRTASFPAVERSILRSASTPQPQAWNPITLDSNYNRPSHPQLHHPKPMPTVTQQMPPFAYVATPSANFPRMSSMPIISASGPPIHPYGNRTPYPPLTNFSNFATRTPARTNFNFVPKDPFSRRSHDKNDQPDFKTFDDIPTAPSPGPRSWGNHFPHMETPYRVRLPYQGYPAPFAGMHRPSAQNPPTISPQSAHLELRQPPTPEIPFIPSLNSLSLSDHWSLDLEEGIPRSYEDLPYESTTFQSQTEDQGMISSHQHYSEHDLVAPKAELSSSTNEKQNLLSEPGPLSGHPASLSPSFSNMQQSTSQRIGVSSQPINSNSQPFNPEPSPLSGHPVTPNLSSSRPIGAPSEPFHKTTHHFNNANAPLPFAATYPYRNSLGQSSMERQSVMSTAGHLLLGILSQVYVHFLLLLPLLYFSRVTRIFEQAKLSFPDLKKMALEMSEVSPDDEMHWVILDSSNEFPPQYQRLKSAWESFISSVIREWKTLNIISVILLSAILTILQIPGAAANPVTRFTALLSLVCALISLLFGCMYIIRFGSMRRTYKAAEWALEAQKSTTSILWNVWILLAMPAIWLTWSIVLYIACIMSFVWLSGPDDDTPPLKTTKLWLLTVRIVITAVLGLGIVYGVLILITFRRYGGVMDKAWQSRIAGWMQEKRGHPYRQPPSNPYAQYRGHGNQPGPHIRPQASYAHTDRSSISTTQPRTTAPRPQQPNNYFAHPSWNAARPFTVVPTPNHSLTNQPPLSDASRPPDERQFQFNNDEHIFPTVDTTQFNARQNSGSSGPRTASSSFISLGNPILVTPRTFNLSSPNVSGSPQRLVSRKAKNFLPPPSSLPTIPGTPIPEFENPPHLDLNRNTTSVVENGNSLGLLLNESATSTPHHPGHFHSASISGPESSLFGVRGTDRDSEDSPGHLVEATPQLTSFEPHDSIQALSESLQHPVAVKPLGS